MTRIALLAAAAWLAGTWTAATATALEAPMGAGIIPPDRLADWRAGLTAGVPGGIPAVRGRRIDVTAAPFGADRTGVTDARSAILQAIASAAEGDAIWLPAGTYRIDGSIGVGPRRRIIIRGDGPDRTTIALRGTCQGGIDIGGGGADWWYDERLKLPIARSSPRGATILELGDTKALDAYPDAGIGQLCQLSLRNDPALPVVVPANFDHMRRQVSRIVGRTPTTVTIAPGLLFDLPASLSPRLAPAGPRAEHVGVEDLTIEGKDAAAMFGLRIQQGHACWARNVSIRNIANYHLWIGDSIHCEVRRCRIAARKGTGSNGAGILFGTSSFCLIEDNIIAEQFPHLEVNGSSGNVFAYNFCHDSAVGDLLGCSICSNHGAHSSFNLYEGNVAPKFQSDGYHGSASHDVAFRNRFHGTSEKTEKFWICVNLNRFTRHYSLVGNVLGRKGDSWLYDNADEGFGYDQHFIYVLGMPNMGNGGYSGTAQPSRGKYWADWARLLASERGKGPGPSGFQEIDLDVRATTLRKGNYNYRDRCVPESESLGGAILPPSLYRASKPEWFGDLAWPPFGPEVNFEHNRIPAQVRFETERPEAEG